MAELATGKLQTGMPDSDAVKQYYDAGIEGLSGSQSWRAATPSSRYHSGIGAPYVQLSESSGAHSCRGVWMPTCFPATATPIDLYGPSLMSVPDMKHRCPTPARDSAPMGSPTPVAQGGGGDISVWKLRQPPLVKVAAYHLFKIGMAIGANLLVCPLWPPPP